VRAIRSRPVLTSIALSRGNPIKAVLNDYRQIFLRGISVKYILKAVYLVSNIDELALDITDSVC